MDIFSHSLLSTRKFGGQPADYYEIHKFMDSSKLFLHHIKHRVLLHHLFGVELAIDLLGDYIKNSHGKIILIRDIASEHCKEDLSGVVPTLSDWLCEMDDRLAPDVFVPEMEDPELEAFIWKPYLRSNLKSSLILTCSDFGVYLAERFMGYEKARQLADKLTTNHHVKKQLHAYEFSKKWQYTPDKKELIWLQNHLESEAGHTNIKHQEKSHESIGNHIEKLSE